MKIGFSGEAYGNLIVLCAIIGSMVIIAFYYMARRRGVDITNRRLQIKVTTMIVIIFGVIPLWLSDMSIKDRVIVTILASAVAAANFLGVDTMQRILRDKFGVKKKKERKEP